MININKETFLLLEEYATSLKKIANKLENDQGFSSLLKNEVRDKSTTSYTIPEYVFFEIATVFNICSEESDKEQNSGKSSEFVQKENERFGIVFIGLKFYNPLFLSDYENIKSLLNGGYREITEYYITYAEKVKEYHNSIPKESRALLFPKILKSSNHHLFDEYVTALYRFSSLIVKMDQVVSVHEEKALKKIWQLTHNPLIPHNTEEPATEAEKVETLEEIIQELDGLIGLTKVKQEVSTLVNFVKIQKEREKIGLKTSKVSYHCVFTGSPGTGKTTVARIIARIYKKLGVLTKGQFIETDRSGLIAEYSGQTAIKVDQVVQSALDGILFIDEAYALIGTGNDDYGREAVATLIKRIEDHRERLVVILAGYPDEMEDFINDNPGLKSRFNRYIHFDDYTAKELLEIYKMFCTKIDYRLTKKAASKLLKIFQELIDNKDETFGNGRLSRNLFEKSIEKQANRLTLSTKPLTKELLISIETEDIPDSGF